MPSTTRLFGFTSVLVLAASAITGCSRPAADNDAQPVECADVLAIFARGSGQLPGSSEARRFDTALRGQLTDDLDVDSVELDYPAVPIDRNVDPSMSGTVSAAPALSFLGSVATGTTNVINQVTDRVAGCPDLDVVLAGYSQGAMVMTQAITELAKTAPQAADQIKIVTTFGDPSLVLPEGQSQADGSVPACRGEQLSPWRAWAPRCTSHQGLSALRAAYVPAEFADKVLAWCAPGDVVCGASANLRDWDAHMAYAADQGPIDEAAAAAAFRLTGQTPAGQALRVRLPLDSYFGKPGEVFRFVAQGSPVLPQDVHVEYDFAGDDAPDAIGQSEVTTSFDEITDARVRLTTRTANAATQHTTADVRVAEANPTARPAAPVSVTATVAGGDDGSAQDQAASSTANVTWQAARPGLAWVVWVNRYPVGLVVGRTSATITDLPAGADVTVGVSGIDLSGVFGAATETTVAAGQAG